MNSRTGAHILAQAGSLLRRKWTLPFVSLLALLLAISVLASCAAPQEDAMQTRESSNSQELIATVPEEESLSHQKQSTIAILQTIHGDYTVSERWQMADCIVAARFEGADDSFVAVSADGESAMVFTDYRFSVIEVFHETESLVETPLHAEGPLTVRMEGGTIGSLVIANEDVPSLEAGTTYLLFLYKLTDGRSCNTEGDHYYLTGGPFGAWEEEGGSFVAPDGSQVGRDELLEMEATYPHLNPEGVVYKPDARDEYLNYLLELVNRGDMPREAYDELVAQYQFEKDHFARIMTEEEMLALEQELLTRSGASLSQ